MQEINKNGVSKIEKTNYKSWLSDMRCVTSDSYYIVITCTVYSLYMFMFSILLILVVEVRAAQLLVSYIVFVDRCLSFCHFDHFRLAIVLHVLLQIMVYDYPFGNQ